MGVLAIHDQTSQVDLEDTEGARAQDHRVGRPVGGEQGERRDQESREVHARRAEEVEQGHPSLDRLLVRSPSSAETRAAQRDHDSHVHHTHHNHRGHDHLVLVEDELDSLVDD